MTTRAWSWIAAACGGDRGSSNHERHAKSFGSRVRLRFRSCLRRGVVVLSSRAAERLPEAHGDVARSHPSPGEDGPSVAGRLVRLWFPVVANRAHHAVS